MCTLGATLRYVELLSVSVGLFLVTAAITDTHELSSHSVVANEGQRIDIPDGCILENRELWVSATNDLILTVFGRPAFW